jgi:NAD-dependent DNA ligase
MAVLSLRCGIGAKIKVVRSGEVIPYILETIEESDEGLSAKCSFGCSQTYIVVDGAHAFCTNPNCPARKKEMFERLIKLYGGKGFSEEMVDLSRKVFGSYNGLVDAIENYTLEDCSKKMFAISMTSHQSKMIKSSIEKLFKKKCKLENIINICIVDGFGETMCRKITEKYQDKTFEKLLETGENIPYGIVNNQRAVDSWKLHYNDIERLLKLFKIDYEAASGLPRVCISGKLDYGTKRDFDLIILKRGYQRSDTTTGIDILISNESDTSKVRDCRKKGIQIMTEKEFLNLPVVESYLNG